MPEQIICPNCKSRVDASLHICPVCFSILNARTGRRRPETVQSQARRPQQNIQSQKRATPTARSAAGSRTAIGPGRTKYRPPSKLSTAKRKLSANSNSFIGRYEEEGAFYAAIIGIVVAIIGFLVFNLNWVSCQGKKYGLLEFSDYKAGYDGLMSFLCVVSYWILLLGSILTVIASIIILIYPKAELLAIVPFIIVIAFALIALVFTANGLIGKGYAVTPVDVITLIIFGPPAAILRSL